VYNIAAKNDDLCQQMCAFISGDEISALEAARQFPCKAYDGTNRYKATHLSLNNLRAAMTKKKDIDLAQLPPCEASFLQHVRRVLWQTKIWHNAHIACPDIGSPEDHGWKMQDGKLIPVLFDGPVASEILDGLLCNCTRKQGCLTAVSCTCKQNNMQCIELCDCSNFEGCGNMEVLNAGI